MLNLISFVAAHSISLHRNMRLWYCRTHRPYMQCKQKFARNFTLEPFVTRVTGDTNCSTSPANNGCVSLFLHRIVPAVWRLFFATIQYKKANKLYFGCFMKTPIARLFTSTTNFVVQKSIKVLRMCRIKTKTNFSRCCCCCCCYSHRSYCRIAHISMLSSDETLET